MNKFFILLGVLVYTLLIGITVFSVSKYYLYTRIANDIETSFIDYDFDTFIEDCFSIDVNENPEPKYGVKEINGQTCFVMEDLPQDPKLVMVLMIPVFLTMDLIPIENKKPKRISLYI